MKSSVTALEDNKVKVSVEIDETEIDSAVDVAFKKIAKQVRLPGFRPGKAPRKVLEAHIGKDYARGEALQEAIPDYYRQAIIEHDVDVISPPDLDVVSGQDDGPVTVEAIVEVRPAVIVAGYNGLRIEIPAPVATDEEIDAQLAALRNQFAERAEVDRPARAGDFVTVDIEGSQDGEPVEGLTAEDYTYEIGSGFIVEEMDENLEGAEVGETLEFEGDHPNDDDATLAFTVVVKKIEEKVLPELTDEFVAEATEFDTAEELRADTRARIETDKKQRSEALIAERTGEALAALVTDDIPEALVQDQISRQVQDMAMRLAQQGIKLDQFLEMTGQDIGDMTENLKEPAEKAARVDLALRAVAIAEGIEISDDDLHEEIRTTAEQIGQDAETLLASLRDNGQLSGLRADMMKHKAMEMLIDSVELVDEDGKAIDRADLVIDDDTDDAGDEGDEPESTDTESAMSDTGNIDADDAVGDDPDDTGETAGGDDA